MNCVENSTAVLYVWCYILRKATTIISFFASFFASQLFPSIFARLSLLNHSFRFFGQLEIAQGSTHQRERNSLSHRGKIIDIYGHTFFASSALTFLHSSKFCEQKHYCSYFSFFSILSLLSLEISRSPSEFLLRPYESSPPSHSCKERIV